MKTLATKERKLAPAVRKAHSSVHAPLGTKNRSQQNKIHQILQPKLTVGQVNDQYEREADSVADRVVENQPISQISSISGSFSSSVNQNVQAESGDDEQIQEKEIQRQLEEEDEQVQLKLIQRQAEDEEEQVQTKLIQRQAEDEEEQVQAKLIQRQAEDEEEHVQTKLILRKTEKEADDEVQVKGAIPSTQAASRAVNSQSSGSPMRPDVRSILESSMGTNLSNVRVHEDSASHEAVASINAKAFTHKNNIWLGAGQSQSDIHLMAHEATHVVQQSGGLQTASVGISQTNPKVQRFWNPVAAVANAVSDAVDWVGDSIGDAVNYVKDKAGELVRSMPGYSLFTVVNGSDPITGRSVERNGRNFIEAGLDVIPNGQALKEKLESEGALDKAVQWLDDQIKELDVNPAEISAQLSRFWNSLGIGDVRRLDTVLDRFLDIVRGPVERIITFARNVASELLEIVKEYLISSLINFINDHTRAYPLLTVILERDPISGEVVERTPMALLRGFMLLSESGEEQLRQMEESGSLQKAADWLNGAVFRLNLSIEMLINGFMDIWRGVGIHSLLDPRGVFQQIYDNFAAPAGRIITFVVEVSLMVLKFIKDALISRLVDYARAIYGYPLLTVLLGKDPFSEAPVERSGENIIHGFMGLMDGGEEQFQEMKQTGAIARLTTRIEDAVATLRFTWEFIRGLFTRAWNRFSLADLAAPIAAFASLMRIFAEPLRRLVNFVGTIIRLVIEVALKIMNFPVELISNIIARTMQAIDDVKRDPIGFLKNLLRAVRTGFVMFFDNISTHLIGGVSGWLFRELEDAGVSPPTDLSFQSILGFVMDVLGVTVDMIFQKLADRIGQDRVDRIRGMIDRLTGIWSFVSDVMTRGPVAIYEYISEQLSNLWNVVLDAVRNWVVTRVIQRVTARLLSMLDPSGIMAVVNGFVAFYSAIQSFIAYLREMLEIVNSFVNGVAEIAQGSVATAAGFLEGSLARGVPVAIGFLANQVGLSGIGRRIGEMIESVREMVDRGINWLIDRAMSAGAAFLNMFRGSEQSSEPIDATATDGGVGVDDGNLDSMSVEAILAMPPSTESRDAEQKQTDLGNAASLVNRLVQQSESTSEVEEYFERIQRRFALRNIAFANLGTTVGGIDISINPQARIEDNRLIWDGEAPPGMHEMNVRFGGTSSKWRWATSMEAKPLGPNHPQGGPPRSTALRDVMQNLVTGQRGNVDDKYIKGHLLNDNIGGPGDAENLFPITARANSQHVNEVENRIKDWINRDRYWVHYKVDVRVNSRESDVDSRRQPEQNFVDADFLCEAHPLLADGVTHANGGFSKIIRSVHNSNIAPVEELVEAGSGDAVSDMEFNGVPELSSSRRHRSDSSNSTIVIDTATEGVLSGLGLSTNEVAAIISGRPFRRHSQIEAFVGQAKWQGIRNNHNIILYNNP